MLICITIIPYKLPASAFKTNSTTSNNPICTSKVRDNEVKPVAKKRKANKFQRLWLQEFEWLDGDLEKEVMLCKYLRVSSSLVNRMKTLNAKHLPSI